MTNPGEDPPVRLKPGKVSVGCQTQQELLAATKDFGSNEPTTSQNNGNKNAQPVTPSTGTTQTEDGLLRLSVADFHHLEDTMCSPSKIINGVPWRIMIMPKQHTTGKKTQKCLAFFLQCCPANTYNDKWTCQAIAEMRLLAQKRGNQNFVRKTTHIYNSKENDWGYSCFMTWAEIIDESQGYIKNGSVIVEIVVRAEAPKNMMTKDDFLFKLKQWYRLAENHMNNDRVDLAIEANQQAVDYCKNKDPEMAKQLKTQKDALVAQKLVESIKRLEDGSSPKKQPQTEGRAAIRSAIAGPMCNNEFCRLHKAKRQCTHLKKTSKPTSAQRNSARTPRAPCSSPRPPGSTIRPTCKSHQEANHTEGACSGSKIAKRADLPIGTGSNQSRGEAKVDDEDLGAESEGSYTDMGQAVDLAEICQVQIATAESSCQTEDITMDREEEGDEDDVEWCHQNSSENNSTEETTSTQDEESNDEGIPEEALTKENGYKRDKRPTTPELLFFHKRPILQAARKNPKGMTEVSPVLLDDHHVSCLLDAFKALQQPKEKNINGQKTNGSTEKTLKKNQHLKWLCDDVDTMVTMISFFKKDFKLYQERHEAQLENTSPMEQHENMAMFFAIGMANYQCDRMTQEVERFLEKSEQLFHGKRMGTLIGRLSGGKLALDDEASVDKSSMDVEFNSDDSRSTTTALSETDASESASLEMCSEEEEEIEIEEGEELHANVSGDRAYNSDLRDVAENLMTFNQSMYTAIGRFKSFGDALSQVSQQVESTVPEKISTCDHGDLQRRLELRTKSLQNEQAAHQLTKKKLEELKAQSSESKSKVEQLNKQLREKTNDNKRLEKKSLKDDAKINELFTDKTEQDEKLKNQKRDTNSLKMKHSDELKTLKLERDQLQVELDKLKKEASMRESQREEFD
ncbi:unnamed protein product, partial [Mesorhabditis belari]|uniref:MATH domain-containing protein n=1 Tax=Mesorhabditis belari TaxID=2138241 RepID=A0AAF3ESA2_9BILA